MFELGKLDFAWVLRIRDGNHPVSFVFSHNLARLFQGSSEVVDRDIAKLLVVVGHEGRPNKVAENSVFILLSLIVLLFFVCHTDTLNLN